MAGTLNGLTALSATIHLPRVGVWWADVVLDGASALAGAAELSYPGWAQKLTGTIVGGGDSTYGRIALRVCGGGGGLGTQLDARAYQGAPVRLPLMDILDEAGEALSATATGGLDQVLPHWVRSQRSATDCLWLLQRKADFVWRFLPDGTFWFGDETWPAATIDYDLMDEFPEDDAVLIATDDLLLPGTTFRSHHVQRVLVSPHESRTQVWFG